MNFDERAKEIEAYFEREKQAELSRLEQEHKKNMETMQAENEAVDKSYAKHGNNLAVQYERNRRNFNEQAQSRGLNTGTASQAALAQNSVYLRDFGVLSGKRAAAREQGRKGLLDLKSDYDLKAAESAAGSDRRKQEVLFKEREKEMQRQLSQAQTLAKFGDFSIYAQLYGKEQADKMEAVWKAQNPDLAYKIGKISESEYQRLTGRLPGESSRRSGGGTRRVSSKKKKPTDKSEGHFYGNESVIVNKSPNKKNNLIYSKF